MRLTCMQVYTSPSNIYRILQTGSVKLGYSADKETHEKQAVFEPGLHVALYLVRAEQNRHIATSQSADLV